MMDTQDKLVLLPLLGGLVGFIIRLAFYLIYKTPAIGFDGPAGYSFVLAVIGGAIIFTLAGFGLSLLRRKF